MVRVVDRYIQIDLFEGDVLGVVWVGPDGAKHVVERRVEGDFLRVIRGSNAPVAAKRAINELLTYYKRNKDANSQEGGKKVVQAGKEA